MQATASRPQGNGSMFYIDTHPTGTPRARRATV